MADNSQEKQSQLVAVLREGIGVVQMVIFKELRDHLIIKHPDMDISNRSMLVGAVLNKLFGQVNQQAKFQNFYLQNQAQIEQEMLSLAKELPHLKESMSDALRVQVLCDNQEGKDSGSILQQAEELGLLIDDRDVPLPSSFMTYVRKLGEEHGLTVPPTSISGEDDALIH